MKKIYTFLFGLLFIGTAFADNIPTSKNYVDTAIAQKQDTITANDGAAQVLTNTGTAGEYGTKGIYDANGEYAAQQNALIDAVTMNAAVQNAIDSEFQCVEYDAHGECLLMDVFGTPTQQILPTGFTALEYIESTGTQYIDTGIKLNSLSYGYHVKFLLNDITARPNQAFSTCWDYWNSSGTIWRVGFGTYTNGKINLNTVAGVDSTTTIDVGGRSGVPIEMKLNGTKLVVNMTDVYDFLRPNGNKISPYTQPIFAARTGSSAFSEKSSGKVFFYKLFDDDRLLFNGIPARRDSDGVLGMYDTVTNSFFTNAGTGEFIAGPVVNLYFPSGN